MQIKSLLVEKERLSDESKQRSEAAENDQERIKTLELKLSQIYSQKEEVIRLIEKIAEIMPSESIRRILSEIIDSVYEQFKLGEESNELENTLLQMEGELRSYAKKEGSGLLGTKVITLRKDVEKSRESLR